MLFYSLLQVLLSDASGTTSLAPMTCTPTPSNTSLLNSLSCVFTATDMNPAVTSSGLPTFLAQLLLNSDSNQRPSATPAYLFAEPFLVQSTGQVQVVERGACATITAKWKPEAVPAAAGGAGAGRGAQKAPELKGTAVGVWPDLVKTCSSATYSYALVLGPGDKNSCTTWQVRPLLSQLSICYLGLLLYRSTFT